MEQLGQFHDQQNINTSCSVGIREYIVSNSRLVNTIIACILICVASITSTSYSAVRCCSQWIDCARLALLKEDDMMPSCWELVGKFEQANGQPYVIYGDPAYGVSRNILAPFCGSQLSRQQADFNKAMSKVRVSVEWTIGKTCQYFSYIDFKKNQNVLLQPVAKYYLVASLLTNCHTCLYGSLTTHFLVWNHRHLKRIYPICNYL